MKVTTNLLSSVTLLVSVLAQKCILENLALAPRTRAYTMTPSSSQEAARLFTRAVHNEMQATGFYAYPDSTISVSMHRYSGDSKVQLAIGTPFRDDVRPLRQYLTLKEGTNSFTVDKYGGLVYVIYTGDVTDESVAITFGDGLVAVPYFRKGRNTSAQWRETLECLEDSHDVVFETDRVISVAFRDYANEFKDQDIELLMDQYDQVIIASDAISGIDGTEGNAPRINKHLITARTSASGGYMAAGIGIFYTESMSPRFLQNEEMTSNWGLWHEVGHTYQQQHWTWSNLVETTVNVYSLASERSFGFEQSRVTINNMWPAIEAFFENEGALDFNTQSDGVKMGLFQQLQMYMGDEGFASLHKRYRSDQPESATLKDQMGYFAEVASIVSQTNLSDFFRKWGFHLDESVYECIAGMGYMLPPIDITTLRDTPYKTEECN